MCNAADGLYGSPMSMSDDATSNDRESEAKRSAARTFIEAGGRISRDGRRKSETTGANIDGRLDKSWVIGGKVGVGDGMDRVPVAKDGPTDAKFAAPKSMPAQFVHKAESVVERTLTPIPVSAAASEMCERGPAMSSLGMSRTSAPRNSPHSLTRNSFADVTASSQHSIVSG